MLHRVSGHQSNINPFNIWAVQQIKRALVDGDAVVAISLELKVNLWFLLW
jgi:hypothetical protein